jgi:hypothetical protein
MLLVHEILTNIEVGSKLATSKTPVDPRPLLLTDKSGPIRQRSLFEWGLDGNTKMPPANPMATSSPICTPIKRPCDQCVIPDEDPDRPISEGDREEDGHFNLMGDGEGDEDDGGEDEDDLDADVDGSSPK